MTKTKQPKFIVISGGVLSGLGKGIASASIGRLLRKNMKVIPIKCDGYLNTDPGTMNPIEHGEVFVLDDGGEVDMDFGHYERFLNVMCKSEWNLTMGKIFSDIHDKERNGDFLGQTVQFIPHVTDEIKSKFINIAKKEQADLVLIEIGGTVGDIENELYLEAVRQLAHDIGKENIVYVHLTYIPIVYGVNEQKTKPTQQSIKLLKERGIQPDIVIGRCHEMIDEHSKHKIALFCGVGEEAVISGVDVDCVYEIPLIYESEGLNAILHQELKLYSPPQLDELRKLVKNLKDKNGNTNPIRIAICGKYVRLEDSYVSIAEALTHVSAHITPKIEIVWIDTEKIEKGEISLLAALENVHGVIVPGGFGIRGIEGKIQVIEHVRTNNIPYLGICYGMQLAVVEFARHVAGIPEAHTSEAEDSGIKVQDKVICLLPGQAGLKKGGTMRLGGHDVHIRKNTIAHKLHQTDTIRRRFRHRWEVNPEYVKTFEAHGMVFSGSTPSGDIMQMMELPAHPYFVGCQYHPELTSRLEAPDPLFMGLVQAAIAFQQAHST